VDRLLLHKGRKFSVRSYCVLWNGQAYLWKEFLVKVHAEPYTRSSTDKDVHVESRAANGSVEAFRGSDLPHGFASSAPSTRQEVAGIESVEDAGEEGGYGIGLEMFCEMVRVLAEKMKPFVENLQKSAANAPSKLPYAILGVDFLFSQGLGNTSSTIHESNEANKLQGWLIEFNYSPCLYDTASFTNCIKQELAEDVVTNFIVPNLAPAVNLSISAEQQLPESRRGSCLSDDEKPRFERLIM
jgi:hypothetical protein